MEGQLDYLILKNLLNNPEYFGKAMPILKSNYFSGIGAQNIFSTVSDYYTEYGKIPTLPEVIVKARNIQGAEIREKIADDIRHVHTAEISNNNQFLLDETTAFVRDAIFDNAIMLGADSMENKDIDLKLKAWELMEQAFKVSIDTDLGLSYDNLEERIEYYQQELYGLLLTRFSEFNKRLGPGFLPGTLSVILAASGVGKSLLMTSMIADFIKSGKNILLVSMEMSAPEIVKRVDADALDLPINGLSNEFVMTKNAEGELIPKLDSNGNKQSMPELIRERFKEAKANGLGSFYTKSYAPGEFSAIMLENLIDAYNIEKGIKFDAIFLDYLGIMKSDRVNMAAGLYSYVKAITEEVRAVAVKHDVPIISASQLNRCFSVDTLVETQNGSVKVKDLKIGDRVRSYNGYNTVKNKSMIEQKKVYKIKTKSGKEIICTADHKFPTNYGTMTINAGLAPGIKLSS